jgi:L-ascorbate metabolism protein UlaG (beta-lactamase superfamily)
MPCGPAHSVAAARFGSVARPAADSAAATASRSAMKAGMPEEAAELTAALRPKITVPHHYAFTSGRMGDKLMTKSDRDPALFVSAARQLAPGADVRVLQPGEPLAL